MNYKRLLGTRKSSDSIGSFVGLPKAFRRENEVEDVPVDGVITSLRMIELSSHLVCLVNSADHAHLSPLSYLPLLSSPSFLSAAQLLQIGQFSLGLHG